MRPIERNELEKAMLCRGVDYDTIQLIIRDFDIRVERLYSLVNPAANIHTSALPTTTYNWQSTYKSEVS